MLVHVQDKNNFFPNSSDLCNYTMASNLALKNDKEHLRDKTNCR